jgi:hypothetical protein
MASIPPNWLGTQETSSGINPDSFGSVAVTGSNTTVTNSLATPTSIILLTARDTTAGAAMPIVNVRSAGSFTVLVAGGAAGLTNFNYLILS